MGGGSHGHPGLIQPILPEPLEEEQASTPPDLYERPQQMRQDLMALGSLAPPPLKQKKNNNQVFCLIYRKNDQDILAKNISYIHSTFSLQLITNYALLKVVTTFRRNVLAWK